MPVEREAMETREQLVEAWERGRRTGTIAVVARDGVLLEARLAGAWSEMRAAAAVQGVTLVPTSGFRTMEQQRRLWAEHQAGTRRTPVARPGYSNHQNGRAVDIAVRSSVESAEYRWLAAHALAYGFRNAGASFRTPEWWHWEWFGAASG